MALGVTSYPAALDTASTVMVGKDFGQSLTTGGVLSSGATSLTVVDGTKFSATGGIILLESELISYVSVTSNTLNTLVRGILGTSAASHASGLPATLVMASTYHNVLKDAIIAIQTELGVLPKGGFADVAARLTSLTSGGTTITANSQSGTSYTLVLADAGKVIEMNNVAGITLTIPTNASVAFPVGTVVEVWQQNSGQITVTAAGGVTLLSNGSRVKTSALYATIGLRKQASDTWVISGDLA